MRPRQLFFDTASVYAWRDPGGRSASVLLGAWGSRVSHVVRADRYRLEHEVRRWRIGMETEVSPYEPEPMGLWSAEGWHALYMAYSGVLQDATQDPGFALVNWQVGAPPYDYEFELWASPDTKVFVRVKWGRIVELSTIGGAKALECLPAYLGRVDVDSPLNLLKSALFMCCPTPIHADLPQRVSGRMGAIPLVFSICGSVSGTLTSVGVPPELWYGPQGPVDLLYIKSAEE